MIKFETISLLKTGKQPFLPTKYWNKNMIRTTKF